MRELDLDLLARLCETPGVSGREDAVRALATEELDGLVDEISVDPMGNLVATRRGEGGPRVMVAAHMDEIGFLVRHVDDRGFLRVSPVGGVFPRYLPAQRVTVSPSGSGEPMVGVLFEASDMGMPNEESKTPKVEEFFVDLGLPGDRVRSTVAPGDAVTMHRTLERVGDRVIAKALDDRIGLFIIIEVLRHLPRGAAEVIALGTVQEEIGTRGSSVAAHRITKDVGVAIDTTLARDLPGVDDAKTVTRLGEGVSIKVMDKYQITHRRLLDFVRGLARERDVPHQLEVGLPGGTDAEAIEVAGDGVPAIAMSIPSRYGHSASEMCDLGDVAATADLLEAFLQEVTVSALAVR
ncbi:MAG TPA: M20/M25/M40 family metallo-hydrolase [Actinomycetota bacterium]|nr:M20/M25/M40 family metallo-hydrolase [Actinomycetota bacterium]